MRLGNPKSGTIEVQPLHKGLFKNCRCSLISLSLFERGHEKTKQDHMAAALLLVDVLKGVTENKGRGGFRGRQCVHASATHSICLGFACRDG